MLSKDYQFDSERLHFRGIQESDADVIVQWRSNPENFMNFLVQKPISLEDHLIWFDAYLKNAKRFDFLIEDFEGAPLGTCGLFQVDEDSCEISYMIGAIEARGKGYAKEAVRALTAIAFREFNVNHVIARILPQNAASMRVVTAEGYVECERVYCIERQEMADGLSAGE